MTTGLLLQELLQGFAGPRAHRDIIARFDALLAQLCIRHELQLLTTDQDFTLAARHCPLRVWKPGS